MYDYDTSLAHTIGGTQHEKMWKCEIYGQLPWAGSPFIWIMCCVPKRNNMISAILMCLCKSACLVACNKTLTYCAIPIDSWAHCTFLMLFCVCLDEKSEKSLWKANITLMLVWLTQSSEGRDAINSVCTVSTRTEGPGTTVYRSWKCI